MQFVQENKEFQPIAIILETEEEAVAMWDVVVGFRGGVKTEAADDLSRKISNYFSNEAKL